MVPDTLWSMQVSLLETQAAVAACCKLRAPLLEPPSEQSAAVVDPVTGIRKADGSLPQLQQLIPQVVVTKKYVREVSSHSHRTCTTRVCQN